jgi:5-methyltetrahydrofolate--homocysteine methyltransferase
MRMEANLKNIYDSIIDGAANQTASAVQTALDGGVDPSRVLNESMITAMAEVGKLFEEGEYFVPEMLISAKAMQTGLAVLKPYLIKESFKSAGKVIAGTVKGDLHDIGKNLVCMMLEGAAFEIVDLGADVSPQKFVDAVRENDADFVAMSALLTTTMPNMKTTIEALQEAGLRDKVKILVGGAPVTSQFAQEIGADGFAPDASRAVALAKSLAG